MSNLLSCAIVAAVVLLPTVASAQRVPALAGQSISADIPGGQQTREYAANGQLIYEVIEREIRRSGEAPAVEAIEREWQDNGSPLRDQTFLGGVEIKGTEWYMNGKVRETRIHQATRDPNGVPGVYIERFSDLGVLQSSGVFQGRFRPVGPHREYDENGTPKREITYNDRGEKTGERTLDATGTPTGQTEFFPDGSRKLN